MKIVTLELDGEQHVFQCGRVTLGMAEALDENATGPAIGAALRKLIKAYSVDGAECDPSDLPVELIPGLIKEVTPKAPLSLPGNVTVDP